MAVTVEPMIVGLDIGSTKVAALVVAMDSDGVLRYVEASHPDPGGSIRAGAVTSIPEATAAITRAVYEVEEKIGRRITSACVAVGGRHLASQNIRGTVAITPRGRDIAHEDVRRALLAAKGELELGDNRSVLHEIPRAYMVDGQIGVQDPHGMAGFELEVEVHCVTGAATTLQNIIKCVRQANVQPALVVAAPLAAGESVRDAYGDAHALAVLDIGLETSKLTVYVSGAVWLSEVLPMGGLYFTQGVGQWLHLSPTPAEELKLRHGHVDPARVPEGELVDLPPSAGIDAVAPLSEIVGALRERAEGFANDLHRRLQGMRRSGVDPEALILVGGGANLPGLGDYLMRALDVPTYVGTSSGIRGLPALLESPDYATVVGLVKYFAHFGPGQDAVTMKGRRGVFGGLRSAMRVVLP